MLKKLRLRTLEEAFLNRTRVYDGVHLHSGHYRVRNRNRYASQKEPDLKYFINSLPAETVFWDVGANVGFFSILAARRGMRVLAFEPDQLTCGVLNQNIFLNRVSERCIALPIALNDADVIDVLSMREFMPANAYNTFGRETNEHGRSFKPAFAQGSVGIRGDGLQLGPSLIEFGQPSFVKIDVDGNELKVVKGMKERLKSTAFLCVELSEGHPEMRDTLDLISSLGFEALNDVNLEDARRDVGGIHNFYFRNARTS
ncbi:MAG: FkbM family methyltransferase [Cyanobacteria bacterium]|nr:FkbM family methyltransferase [Cyanobacteriota bacterium]